MAYSVDAFVMCPRHQDPGKALDFGFRSLEISHLLNSEFSVYYWAPPAVQSEPSDLLTGSNFPILSVRGEHAVCPSVAEDTLAVCLLLLLDMKE